MAIRKICAVSAIATVIAAPLVAAQPAVAEPLGGWCPKSVMTFETNPLGMTTVPMQAGFNADIGGCTDAPSSDVAFRSQFNGNGSCNDAIGNLEGTLNWANGEVSRVAGQWHVPGGNPAAPVTNVLNIMDGPGAGGRLHIDQAPVDSDPLVGACMNGTMTHGRIPIASLHFN
ncbi:hypothetical protein DFR70_101930 [Nocardia tenerifensis]|uniref:LppP/LprE lipoprotein n=1 Tax=Nocardia tenerifensis TaxID=228006 RepID=A0A318KBK1_9NOCA|nr:hypothetical protein [Nocardia tenerifensis]PXX71496.1 hypothetical protein DFR70_101930 [Nocardia tenerifensis]